MRPVLVILGGGCMEMKQALSLGKGGTFSALWAHIQEQEGRGGLSGRRFACALVELGFFPQGEMVVADPWRVLTA